MSSKNHRSNRENEGITRNIRAWSCHSFILAPVKSSVLKLHAFFYKQCFFSNQPQCCLTFAWIQLQMLLSTYKHHHTETRFIFTKYVSLSRSRSIYVVSMWSIFHFHYVYSYNLMNTDTLFLSCSETSQKDI